MHLPLREVTATVGVQRRAIGDAAVFQIAIVESTLCAANKCVMTIISSGVHYSVSATRLACLRDVMALKRVQRTPVIKLTVAGVAGDHQQQQQQTKQQKQQQQQAMISFYLRKSFYFHLRSYKCYECSNREINTRIFHTNQ